MSVLRIVVCVHPEWQSRASNLYNVYQGPTRYSVSMWLAVCTEEPWMKGSRPASSKSHVSAHNTYTVPVFTLNFWTPQCLTGSSLPHLAQLNPWPSTYVLMLSSSHLDLPGQLRASQCKHCETILDEAGAQDTIFCWKAALKVYTTQVQPSYSMLNWKILQGGKVSLTELRWIRFSISWALEHAVVRTEMSALELLVGRHIYTQEWGI